MALALGVRVSAESYELRVERTSSFHGDEWRGRSTPAEGPTSKAKTQGLFRAIGDRLKVHRLKPVLQVLFFLCGVTKTKQGLSYFARLSTRCVRQRTDNVSEMREIPTRGTVRTTLSCLQHCNFPNAVPCLELPRISLPQVRATATRFFRRFTSVMGTYTAHRCANLFLYGCGRA